MGVDEGGGNEPFPIVPLLADPFILGDRLLGEIERVGFSGEWLGLIRVPLIVCVKTDVVCPCSHFISNQMGCRCLVYAAVEGPSGIAFVLEHGVYRTCREHDTTAGCMQTFKRLAEVCPGTFRNRCINGLARGI
jgi:hypothetical protein